MELPPRIQPFWETLVKDIKIIIGIMRPLQAEIFLLNFLPDHLTMIISELKETIGILLAVARLPLEVHCKFPNPPLIKKLVVPPVGFLCNG